MPQCPKCFYYHETEEACPPPPVKTGFKVGQLVRTELGQIVEIAQIDSDGTCYEWVSRKGGGLITKLPHYGTLKKLTKKEMGR